MVLNEQLNDLEKKNLPPNGLSLKLVTAPVNPTITTAEAKLYLRVDHSDEDALIDLLIRSAQKRAENLLNLKLITQTWNVFWDRFPSSSVLELKTGFLQSVTHVKYTLEDGTQSTLSNTNYKVDITGPHGRIVLNDGATWPTDSLTDAGAVEVQVVVGFGTLPADVPDDIKLAVYEIVSSIYEHRGDEKMNVLPASAVNLLGPYRVDP